jgi:diguanylate cyclase (GGDEF)-like protein
MRTSVALRSVRYACAGGLAAAGAPLGLLALRCAQRDRHSGCVSLHHLIRELASDRAGYFYVGASTALALTLFGFLLGRQADRLASLSETDPLTGLRNARGLLTRLDAELARCRRYRGPLTLLLVDLDGLKDINDAYGHEAGDSAIRSLANVIRAELRTTDAAARWGGDEFAIVAPDTSRAAALALAERIRTSVPAQNARWRVTASLGLATAEPDERGDVPDSAVLMRRADVAMYEAKRAGRNTIAAAPVERAGDQAGGTGGHRFAG